VNFKRIQSSRPLTKKRGHRASTRHPKNPKKPIENYIFSVRKTDFFIQSKHKDKPFENSIRYVTQAVKVFLSFDKYDPIYLTQNLSFNRLCLLVSFQTKKT